MSSYRTNADLRQDCANRGLITSGKKNVLEKRIKNHQLNNPTWTLQGVVPEPEAAAANPLNAHLDDGNNEDEVEEVEAEDDEDNEFTLGSIVRGCQVLSFFEKVSLRTAMIYQHVAGSSASAVLLASSLEKVSPVRVGDVILVCAGAVDVTVLDANSMVVLQKDFYEVLGVTGTTVIFRYVTSLDVKKKRKGESLPTREFEAKCADWYLRTGGDLKRGVESRKKTEPASTRTEGSMVAGKVYLDAYTGKNVQLTDAKNIVVRMDSSRAMRRLSCTGVLSKVLTNDVVFEPLSAWKTLVAMGAFGLERASGAKGVIVTPGTEKWKLLQYLPIHNLGVEYFRGVASGELFESGGVIKLEMFTTDGSKLTHFDQGRAKIALSSALLGLEQMMIFCHSSAFNGVTKDICERLQCGDLSAQMWDGNYVRWELEGVLRLFFHSVFNLTIEDFRLASEADGHVTDHNGCAQWLKKLLEKFNPTDTDQNLFLRKLANSTAWKQPQTSAGGVVAKKTISKPTPVNTQPHLGVCRIHLLHHVGAKNKTGVVFNVCQNDLCKFQHPEWPSPSKASATELVDQGEAAGILKDGLLVAARLGAAQWKR